MAGGATGGAIEDGHTLCGSTESRTKTIAAGSETKCLDIGRDVAETWRLVDERVATRRDPRYCQADRRRLGKEIGKSLSKDRRRRT